jgi:6-pyruvoyl-tetrahydropterin synthase
VNTLGVKHNIEVAHRLSLLPGKCENIHGHSMMVTLEFKGGQLDGNGIYEGLNFSDVKKSFRNHLDATYDHRLLLNEQDDFAKYVLINPVDGVKWEEQPWTSLPGLQVMPGDPTTENIAKWIQEWAHQQFGYDKMIAVTVWETMVNMASVES